MITRIPFILAALLLAPLAQVRAGDIAPADASLPADNTPPPSKLKMSYELDADTAYVGDAHTNLGRISGKGDLSEEDTSGRFVVAPQYNDGPIFRFGLAYQRYSFGFSKAAPIPNILQAENLVVGVDFELFNSWLVRVEADPGLYSDARSVGYRDFNVPFTIGGSYIASETLQWVVGIEVDINRQIPVFPGVGMRWALNDNWVIDAILPTPRLEYDWSKALTLYLGANVQDGTYRVDTGLGATLRHRNLGGSVVEYDEVRVGAGLSWKASKAITFEVEAGYLPYREFDYHRDDVHFNNDTGAPYGQVSLNTQF